MSMVGKLTFFFLFQIQQREIGIFISQEKCTQNLIKKFDLEQAKAKRTPAATHIKIFKDNSGKKVDESLYHSIIDSLLYLTVSQPDISMLLGCVLSIKLIPGNLISDVLNVL